MTYYLIYIQSYIIKCLFLLKIILMALRMSWSRYIEHRVANEAPILFW